MRTLGIAPSALSRLAVRRGGQQRADDIADVGEVTSLTSIAEDDDGLTPRDGIDELVECHIRSLAGTVYAEKAEWHDRQSERLPVDLPEQLCRQLRHAVRRDRMKRSVLAHGQGRVAVDRR